MTSLPPSIENQYQEHQEEEYQEFLEFKEKKLREKGILPDGSPLGDSVHPETIKSYRKLKLSVPDNVRLATLRPYERMKRVVLELKGKLDIQTSITKVYRLKDKGTGKQYIVWDKNEQITDLNGSARSAEYRHCGQHQIVSGTVRRNAKGEITSSEITEYKTIFEKEWSAKAFDELMKQHNGEGSTTEFIIGYTKNKGKNAVISREDNRYAIHNKEDLASAKFEELLELSERALSGPEPSIHKLANPISEDPKSSIHKQARGYISPDKISYAQTSYR